MIEIWEDYYSKCQLISEEQVIKVLKSAEKNNLFLLIISITFVYLNILIKKNYNKIYLKLLIHFI